jgi:exopolysaccharide biosynthesis polyprenyl glycosylphosphotransferase
MDRQVLTPPRPLSRLARRLPMREKLDALEPEIPKRPARDRARQQAVLDAVMITAAALAALLTADPAGLSPHVGWAAAFSVATFALLARFGAYRPRFAPHFLDDVRLIIGATAVAAMAIAFLPVLILDRPDAADTAVRSWLFAVTYLVAGRAGDELVELRRRRRGISGDATLIVGAGLVGRRVAARLLERPEFGLRPIAFLDDDPLEVGPDPVDIPVLGSGWQGDPNEPHVFGPGLELAVTELGITHVVVSFSSISHIAELDLIRRCEKLDLTVSLLPRLFESIPDQTSVERLGGLPLISVHPRAPDGWQFAVKYAADRLFALLVLVLTSWVLAGAAVATWITLGRPILFRQTRVGLDGHRFELLKFRTMRSSGADDSPEEALVGRIEEGLAPGGVEGEDRRTRVGAFLRRTSIDELPQLINVVRGDMSLIGPRPERPSFVRRFDESVYRYADRHRVKSGITGWSQVHGLRGQTSLADRVEWDNYYIENWSLWLDLKIVLRTITAVFRDAVE